MIVVSDMQRIVRGCGHLSSFQNYSILKIRMTKVTEIYLKSLKFVSVISIYQLDYELQISMSHRNRERKI